MRPTRLSPSSRSRRGRADLRHLFETVRNSAKLVQRLPHRLASTLLAAPVSRPPPPSRCRCCVPRAVRPRTRPSAHVHPTREPPAFQTQLASPRRRTRSVAPIRRAHAHEARAPPRSAPRRRPGSWFSNRRSFASRALPTVRVTIEMVLGEVEEHPDLGREHSFVLELEARGLLYDGCVDCPARRHSSTRAFRHCRPPPPACPRRDGPRRSARSSSSFHWSPSPRRTRSGRTPSISKLSDHLDTKLTRVGDGRRIGGHAGALDDRSWPLRGEKLHSIRSQVDFDARLPKPPRRLDSLHGLAAVAGHDCR